MEHFSINQDSSQEMHAIRQRRRKHLCQALTIIGSIFLLIFGSLMLKEQRLILGNILLGCMIAGLVNIYLLQQTNQIERSVHILNGILYVLSLTLLITGGKDNTGMLWIYPILAINLFINHFRTAFFLYGSFLIVSALLLFTPLSQYLQATYPYNQALRFEITLLALWAICLAALRSEENAYDLLIKVHNEDVHQLAYFDSLTGLPNRWSFQTNLERLLKRMDTNQRVGLIYIDLDNFKQVNDSHGHKTGDKLLLEFSKQLKDIVRPTDIVASSNGQELARLAGDEFVVVVPNLTEPSDAGQVAQRILNLFEGGFTLDGINHAVYASAGISIFPDDAKAPGDLLHYADVAMYSAKQKGHNSLQFFTEEIAQTLHQRKLIESGLKLATSSKLFNLLYMPIFDARSLEIVAIEALIRCQHPALEGIGPDQFIPVAETTGLIRSIDFWVIDNALEDYALLRETLQFKGRLCINISGIQLHYDHFPQDIKQQFDKHRIDPANVELEITETALVSEEGEVKDILQELSELGVSLSLDDFGTGYTAFNQLLSYPANVLKIDRSFVNDIFSDNPARRKMITIIQNLAELYGLEVIAEGVETDAQLTFLRDIGCNQVQGHLLSKPLTLEELIVRLKTQGRVSAG